MTTKWLNGLIKTLSQRQGLNDRRGASREIPELPLTEDPRENAQRVLDAVNHSIDVVSESLTTERHAPQVLYLKSMIDTSVMQRDIIRPLKSLHLQGKSWNLIHEYVTIGQRRVVEELTEAILLLMDGWTLVALPGQSRFQCFKTDKEQSRPVSKAENQSIVMGPQEAFSESLEINISLIRKRLKTPDLEIISLVVGDLTQTKVIVLGIKGIVNDEYMKLMIKRIRNIETDGLIGSGELVQLLDDQPLSPFPQYNLSERPDSVVAGLIEGKVAVIVAGSPYAFTGPSSFIEFFHSPEDYYNRWAASSLVRMLRLMGVIGSITFSGIYVATLQYHYEIIPANMLKTIALSRAKVPFPPLYEALFLELTLEVLREAGARLPAKVGQTMGIVGGIVIGQAAVSAGFTSNVMIIVVSLSALASFVTPSYVMGNAVRVVRFPVIVLAGMWGFLGLTSGVLMILIHLLNLSSLHAPYMSPFAPLRLADLKDTFLRLPTQLLSFRPMLTRSKRNRKNNSPSLKRK
ncbi:spore germination protein [Tumebacillus permanentifrigoris]|uniref:GerA spore germination protein n=1 Tax=Tumebacillus permanentifrigoris TaxID=378543 RepID=A0A316DFF1_9BACL|nr:spore germination protein [Tumebacillus permanentifrigoris]PWK15929.1 GerA spore germination protein [Tumebacillus permanentifrigoris]